MACLRSLSVVLLLSFSLAIKNFSRKFLDVVTTESNEKRSLRLSEPCTMCLTSTREINLKRSEQNRDISHCMMCSRADPDHELSPGHYLRSRTDPNPKPSPGHYSRGPANKLDIYFGNMPSLRGQYTAHQKHIHDTNFHYCTKYYSSELCKRCHTDSHCTACRPSHPCVRCIPVHLYTSCPSAVDTMHSQVPNSCRRCTKGEGENINKYPGRYLGEGRVYFSRDRRDLYLECNFNDPGIQVVSNAVWQKIEGPYPYKENPPTLRCPLCTIRLVDSDGYRYQVNSVGGKSILRVRDFRRKDWGVYRCVVTAKKIHTIDTETVFRIVVFL